MSNSKRRVIAFVTHSHYPRDPRVSRQAQALVASGWHVHVVCLRATGEPRSEEVRGVQVRRLPIDRHRGAPLVVYLLEYGSFCALAGICLLWLCLRHGLSVIQVASPPDFLILAGLLPKAFGVRLVFDVHDNSPELARSRFGLELDSWAYRAVVWWERFAFRIADIVLSPNTGQQAQLLRRGLPERKTHIVLNSPDEEVFNPAEYPKGLDSNGRFTVVCHGTVVRRYGADLLVRAAVQVRDRIPGLAVHIFGDGDFLPELRKLCRDLRAEDVVLIHGFQPVKRVAACLASADLCVIPTRRDVFTELLLPTRLLEAAMLDVACVMTRTETVEQIVDDQAVAYFESENVDGLAEWLVRLARSPEDRTRMAARTREQTKALAWSVQKGRYLDLLEGPA